MRKRHRKIVACKNCGENKPHEGFGLCKLCYRHSKPLSTCKRCEKKYKGGIGGLCDSCNRVVKKGIVSIFDRTKERNFIRNGIGIFTTKSGKEYEVDLIDFEKYKDHLWNENHKGYAAAMFNEITKTLHKCILPNHEVVDHMDGNKKNCKRNNLREATHSINARNRKNTGQSKSGVMGVFQYKDKDRWIARMCVNGKNTHIGMYDSKEKAKEGWIEFAKKHNVLQYYRKSA